MDSVFLVPLRLYPHWTFKGMVQIITFFIFYKRK